MRRAEDRNRIEILGQYKPPLFIGMISAFKFVLFFPSLNVLAMSSCVGSHLTLKVRTNL
jgi:hypothetical protein